MLGVLLNLRVSAANTSELGGAEPGQVGLAGKWVSMVAKDMIA